MGQIDGTSKIQKLEKDADYYAQQIQVATGQAQEEARLARMQFMAANNVRYRDQDQMFKLTTTGSGWEVWEEIWPDIPAGKRWLVVGYDGWIVGAWGSTGLAMDALKAVV